jgi:hypothetical protein
MRSYWVGLCAGILGPLVAMAGLYGVLASTKRLPAPAITRIEYLDEKLRFLRERPELKPEIVAVGSSIAWRQLDGDAFAERFGENHVLNGATAFLKVHQTRYLTHYYLDRFPDLQTVLLMLGPTDFRDCAKIAPELFDPDDATAYAFDRSFAPPFYLKYFAPLAYLRRAKGLPKQRTPLIGEMWLDEYGSAPIQAPKEMVQGRGELYGAVRQDQVCVDAFLRLIPEIKARGVRPIVAFPPIHPEYRRRFPQSIADLRAVADRLRAAMGGDVVIVDSMEEDFAPTDFFDAVHLQWTAVQIYSERLAQAILPILAPTQTGSIGPNGEGGEGEGGRREWSEPARP